MKGPAPFIDLVPGLLVRNLSRNDDFIMTYGTDPNTAQKKIRVLTVKFISSRMVRKLMGQAEAQRDEGSSVTTGDWRQEYNFLSFIKGDRITVR